MITVLTGEGVVPEVLYVNIWLVQVRFTALALVCETQRKVNMYGCVSE